MRLSTFPFAMDIKVSIHASVKDATWFCLPLSMLGRGFNPRICKRCDTIQISPKSGSFVSIHASVKDATAFYPNQIRLYTVSIHASVKDATSLTFSFLSDNPVSIHASVKDATKPVIFDLSELMFQSTHL